MRKVATIGAILLLCVTVIAGAGCGDPSTTPSGAACTLYEGNYCYYYVHNGTAVACDVQNTDSCANTKGAFYFYFSDGKTYYCSDGSHYSCTAVNNAPVTPPVPECPSPKIAYDTLADKGEAWKVIDQEQDQNTTPSAVQVTFTSTKSSTVTVSASIDITATADFILPAVYASVQAHINASVTKSATTVVGNNYSLSVPAGKTAYGIYGVKVQITSGHLYITNPCKGHASDYGNVVTYVPIAPGWCVWLSGNPPCLTVP